MKGHLFDENGKMNSFSSFWVGKDIGKIFEFGETRSIVAVLSNSGTFRSNSGIFGGKVVFDQADVDDVHVVGIEVVVVCCCCSTIGRTGIGLSEFPHRSPKFSGKY